MADIDAEIVQDLVDAGWLSAVHQDVWLHRTGRVYGADGFAMNIKYGVGTRTLQKWAAEARMELACEKVLRQDGRVRFGHSIASGSRVRFAQDGTPQGHVPGSAWNPERIQAAMAGTRRQNEKLPPKLKRKS